MDAGWWTKAKEYSLHYHLPIAGEWEKIHTFLMGTSVKWKANSFIHDFNLCYQFHFLHLAYFLNYEQKSKGLGNIHPKTIRKWNETFWGHYVFRKSYLSDKIKQVFFKAVTVSILLYGCTTSLLTKRMEKTLSGNYTKMLHIVLNKSEKQHPIKQQQYGHLPTTL